MLSAIASSDTAQHIDSHFQPVWWCRNCHTQTLWPLLSRRQPKPAYQRERMVLCDGDFVDLDWLGPEREDAPITIIFHGLGGSSRSHYVRTLSVLLAQNDIRSCVMHFRGCGGTINEKPRSYHGGETRDPDFVIQQIQKRYPRNKLFAVGYSLGASVLLKWLGEKGQSAPIKAAVAVSVPFDLGASARHLETGMSQIYQYWLLRHLKNTVRKKVHLLSSVVNVPDLLGAQTVRTFDELGTAPVHGFRDAEDYYKTSSCQKSLGNISIPVLIIQAMDDPLICPLSVPRPSELGPTITLEVSRQGGHVGFVGKSTSDLSKYWLDARIMRYLNFWY